MVSQDVFSHKIKASRWCIDPSGQSMNEQVVRFLSSDTMFVAYPEMPMLHGPSSGRQNRRRHNYTDQYLNAFSDST